MLTCHVSAVSKSGSSCVCASCVRAPCRAACVCAFSCFCAWAWARGGHRARVRGSGPVSARTSSELKSSIESSRSMFESRTAAQTTVSLTHATHSTVPANDQLRSSAQPPPAPAA